MATEERNEKDDAREALGELLGKSYRAVLPELRDHRLRPLVEELYRSHIRAAAEVDDLTVLQNLTEVVRKGMHDSGVGGA